MTDLNKIKLDLKLQHHFWFWTIYFLLNFLRWGAYFNDYEYSFKSNLLEFSLHIPLVYFNLFFLVPRYVLKSRYLNYIFLLLISLLCIYLIRTGITYFIISENIWPEANREYKPLEINHIVAVCIGELYVLALASSVYLTLNWINEKTRNQALVEEQLKTKLKYLKNQIQPHFFFNTLNNLYSLSLTSSDKVPNVIIKLSNLMEYVLYEVKANKPVRLFKEIEYIQNYVEIEKLRFEHISVLISVESNIDEVKVPPLLFISLIENAFKHGYNKNLKIKINFRIDDQNKLEVKILNNFVSSQNAILKKGIGIQNTKKRLRLIFKDNYTFEQKIKLNYYIIRLQIPLNNED